MKIYLDASTRIILRAHIRSVSEEIRKRKALKKNQKFGAAVREQLYTLKKHARLFNLMRAFLDGKTYASVERSHTENISAKELHKFILSYVSYAVYMKDVSLEKIDTWLK